MEKNNIEQQGGLSPSHLKELEGVLSSLLTNQEIIMEQNKELLSAKKYAKIWGIIKLVLFLLLTFGSVLYLPQIINNIMGEVTSNLNIDNMVKNKQINIDTNRIKELEQLLR